MSAPSSPVPGGVAVSARYSPDSATATATTYKATLAMFEGNLATQTDALQPERCEEELGGVNVNSAEKWQIDLPFCIAFCLQASLSPDV